MVGGTSIGKTICSICYEDLKPLVEDLQAISICGHVFHELCLQQWFEYCSSAKKCSCPVCKQSCSASNVNRLYFQSVGDSNDPILSQNVEDEDPRELRGQVQRLEVKVKGLSSLLERQGKELKDVNGQLCSCKELAKQEAALKNEALKQRTSMQQMLHMKSEELEKSTLERLRLQEKNMSLAKELAAFKLVSDLDLDEGEVLKLASFGNGANNKDTIDILRKSLVMRNRSYKELMAKCNLLGRGEARFGKKLEKAKEKINILKTRLQELETALEVKDNEVLRSLKASKKSSSKRVIQNAVNCNSSSNPLPANNFPSEDQEKHLSGSKLTSDQTGSLTSNPLCSRKLEKFSFTNHMKSNKKDVTEQTTTPLRSEEASDLNKETKVHRLDNLVGHLGSKTGINNDMGKTHATLDKDVILVPDDVTEVEPMLNIRKESPSPLPLSEPGDVCFSGGFLGPDGTNRYLGKWCKRGLSKESNTGNLIAVGADGRGGRIKVLRSLSQSSLDGKETSVGAKRFKSGAKTNNSQSSQGCLQIEHFFGRVVNN
nr:e3 ubiquitin-protein ligase rnf5 [Quercus suber]